MLILGRNAGQRIFVGDDITVMACKVVSGNRMRIGIDCPDDIPVHREEVRRQILREAGQDPDAMFQRRQAAIEQARCAHGFEARCHAMTHARRLGIDRATIVGIFNQIDGVKASA